jgi:hypothetical protein
MVLQLFYTHPVWTNLLNYFLTLIIEIYIVRNFKKDHYKVTLPLKTNQGIDSPSLVIYMVMIQPEAEMSILLSQRGRVLGPLKNLVSLGISLLSSCRTVENTRVPTKYIRYTVIFNIFTNIFLNAPPAVLRLVLT